VAKSLLLSLLDVSEEDYAKFPEEARRVLLSVLYDAWSRNEGVELVWLEALQSSEPHLSLTVLREKLKATVLEAAHALKVKTK
jgi:hypothetical protein